MSYLARRKSKSNVSKKCTDVTYTVNNLPSLRRKRTIAYNRIAKALEIGTLANTDDSQIELFLSYCQEIKNIADSFQESHLIISDLLGDDVDDSENEIQDRFDEAYFNVVAIQRKYLPCSSQQPDTSRQDITTGSHSSNMRLPKITLPTFSGAIKEWPEFIATYNALIHESTNLSEIEKFHYLVSVLRGDPLSLIRTFPVASEHYLSAYNALKSRYEDKRDLAFTCWRDILDVSFKTTNAQDFRHALDTIDENLTILKQLKLPTEHWDFVLCYNILAKLDTKLRREFEEKHVDVEMPQYKQIRAFLHGKSEALLRDTHFTAVTSKNANTSKEATGTLQQPKRHNVTHTLLSPTANPVSKGDELEVQPKVSGTPKVVRKCSFCGEEHHISACNTFLAKSVDERMAVTTERKWCYNCLNASHSVRQCTSIFSCQKCKRKHNTLLHREQAASNPEPSGEKPSSVVLLAKEPLTTSNSPSDSTVLLATALVQIRDASGKFQTFRALFDTGSQNNFLTTHAAQRLKLEPTATSDGPCVLGGAPASVTGQVTCDVGAKDTVHFRLEMFVSPHLCADQPIGRLNTSGWDDLKTLPLADPGFDIPGPIDVLLAADVFSESLLDQRLKRCVNQPRALNSVFGWLIVGRIRLASSSLLSVPSLNKDESLNNIVQRFWEIDTVPHSSRLTPDDQLCEKSFTTEHYRDETGRYVVCLPFKDNAEPLFEGPREIALRRIHAIEKHLSREPDLKQQDVDFMTDDYSESGRMSLVPAKKAGPEIKFNNAEIPFHYREHEAASMATVLQLYRPITVAPHYRDYRRILWRLHLDEPFQEYVLHTATFGVSSAPFLACRTIQQLANDEGHTYLKVTTVLASDTHVDDVVTGSSPLDDARVVSHAQPIVPTACWRPGPSGTNPADICSRGQSPRELLTNTQWWAGPQWLSQTQSEWPTDPSKDHTNDNVLSLVTKQTESIKQTSIIDQLLERYSSFDKVCRVLAYVGRFCTNVGSTASRSVGLFKTDIERHRALLAIHKAYLCLFVCLRTKAVLVEAILPLSTESSLAALHPIVSRLGFCNVIRSDCGTNFVGASSQLAACIERTSHAECIAFKRNLPAAPHFGAIWETQIKAAKTNLYRIVGDQILPFEQLESIFNSRPLCPLSSDRNDLNALTPRHFLTFEYLHVLKQRVKWTKDSIPFTENSVVLIKYENRPPLHWPLGRGVSLHNGPDGVVRVATVKTAKDHLVKRPLVKLCPLPSE